MDLYSMYFTSADEEEEEEKEKEKDEKENEAEEESYQWCVFGWGWECKLCDKRKEHPWYPGWESEEEGRQEQAEEDRKAWNSLPQGYRGWMKSDEFKQMREAEQEEEVEDEEDEEEDDYEEDPIEDWDEERGAQSGASGEGSDGDLGREVVTVSDSEDDYDDEKATTCSVNIHLLVLTYGS